MHGSGGCNTQGQGARRSVTARALRRSSGVLESCPYRVFRLCHILLPLARPRHPRWDYTYSGTGYMLNFRIKRAATVRISAQQ